MEGIASDALYAIRYVDAFQTAANIKGRITDTLYCVRYTDARQTTATLKGRIADRRNRHAFDRFRNHDLCRAAGIFRDRARAVRDGIFKIRRLVGQRRDPIFAGLSRVQHQLVGQGGQLLRRDRAAIARRGAKLGRKAGQTQRAVVPVDARPFRFGIVQIERLPIVGNRCVEVLFDSRDDLRTAIRDRLRKNGHGDFPRRFGRGFFRGFRLGRDLRLRRGRFGHGRFLSRSRRFGHDRFLLRSRRFGHDRFLLRSRHFGGRFSRRLCRFGLRIGLRFLYGPRCGRCLHRRRFHSLAQRRGQRAQQQRQRQQTCQKSLHEI